MTTHTFPGTSRGTRRVERLLRHTARHLLARGQLTPALLRRAYLSDFAGVLLPLPRGARTRPVGFEVFDAETVRGRGLGAPDGRVVLYFHGGGFVGCGLRTHRRLVARISVATGAPVLNVAYRQLPIATLDESVADCVTAYRWLLDQGYRGDQIVLAGDSAGGYLTFATALAALADGLPGPGAIVALSPWLDLECAHSLGHANAATDPYLPIHQLARIAALLPGGLDPLESLLEADLSALPPVLIQVGSAKVLLSDAELMTQRLEAAEVAVHLQVWQHQVHVFQAFADLVPEGHRAIAEIGRFVRTHADTQSPARAVPNRAPTPSLTNGYQEAAR
jgi:acetyl esterase/lipase